MKFVDLSHNGHLFYADADAIARFLLPDVPMDDPNTSNAPQAPLRTYDVTDQQHADLSNRFVYHGPKADQLPRYQGIRDAARRFAEFVLAHTPPSREQSHALTLIDDAAMNANAAIARHEK